MDIGVVTEGNYTEIGTDLFAVHAGTLHSSRGAVCRVSCDPEFGVLYPMLSSCHESSYPEGVHGNNRLGGNSLLDCVVYGRVTGLYCMKHVLGCKAVPTSLAELSGGGFLDRAHDEHGWC